MDVSKYPHLWVFYSIHTYISLDFVCIMLCEIFILTLSCDTYFFLPFVCIIRCEIFILTLMCHTYIFLHFVCIILCEIFILTLLCPTFIFLHFGCIILCEIFIAGVVNNRFFNIGYQPGCFYQLSPLWNAMRSCLTCLAFCRLRL